MIYKMTFFAIYDFFVDKIALMHSKYLDAFMLNKLSLYLIVYALRGKIINEAKALKK